jgi:orotidine-5'-phosphate decarboxylase
VLRLADLAQSAGLDGVVCSPFEISAIRKACGSELKLIVPGIRPEGAAANDQKRILTPKEALKRGADFLVIGRPITDAPDRANAARVIAESLR